VPGLREIEAGQFEGQPEAIMFWVLMNVKNPDISLPTADPLPNTGHIVVVGSPKAGWTLKDWDGTPH
jgi:hypothetical protein